MSQNRAILESSGTTERRRRRRRPAGAPRRKGRKQMADRKAERQARKANRKRKRERARLERYVNALIRAGVPLTLGPPDGPASANPPSASAASPPKQAQADQVAPRKHGRRVWLSSAKTSASIRDTDKSTLYEKGKPMARKKIRKGSPKRYRLRRQPRPPEFGGVRGTQVVPIVPVDDENVPSAIVGLSVAKFPSSEPSPGQPVTTEN